MFVRRYPPIVAFLASMIIGCSSSENPGVGTGGPTGKQALEDLAQLLKDFDQQKKKPPAAVAAVAPVEPLYQAAYLGVVRGDIVYTWGAPIDTKVTTTVIAYEKQTPAEGGYVLLQDGTVKQMTADEFKAAPKAGK